MVDKNIFWHNIRHQRKKGTKKAMNKIKSKEKNEIQL